MSDSWWVIEMQGPAYLAVRHLGGYEFCWCNDIQGRDGCIVLKFTERYMADQVMMAIRQLRGDLFPSCLTTVPCAVEHAWMQADKEYRRVLPKGVMS